jgi:hypothetical protein
MVEDIVWTEGQAPETIDYTWAQIGFCWMFLTATVPVRKLFET